MDDENKILNGIKTNDIVIWNELYNDLMPVAISFVTKNSGSADDAKDLFQEALLKVLLKCRKGYQHDNIEAIIVRRLKWDWLAMLRSNKKRQEIELEIKASPENSGFDLIESEKIAKSKIDIKKRFHLSKQYLIKLKKKCRTEDFLNDDNLNKIQKKMVRDLLKMGINNPACKKLLMLTEFLPLRDTAVIAREMGYITEETEAGIKKGKDTLKTRKTYCLNLFRQYFNK
jgi:DNA-directed RNA polymerase specialized sigma24 family protein